MKRHYYARRDTADMRVEILVFETKRARDLVVYALDGKARAITAEEAERWRHSGRKRFATFYDMSIPEYWDGILSDVYDEAVAGLNVKEP
jgi:hypothetical protein